VHDGLSTVMNSQAPPRPSPWTEESEGGIGMKMDRRIQYQEPATNT